MNFCELFKKNYEYSKTRSLWTFYEQKNIFLWTIRLEILFWQHWMESQFCFDHFFATTLLSVFGSTIWVCCFDTLFATTPVECVERIWFDYLSVLLRQFFCYIPCWVCWAYLVRLFECVASTIFLLQPLLSVLSAFGSTIWVCCFDNFFATTLLSVLSVLSVFGSTICASTIFASNLKNRKTA